MKKLIYLLISFILVAASGINHSAASSSDSLEADASIGKSIKVTAQSILAEAGKGRYAQGKLLVKFKAGTDISSSLSVHNAVGASLIKRYSFTPDLEYVNLPQGLSVEDAIVQYMSDPNVEYAAPNYIRRIASLRPVIPNDMYFGNQWALYNTGKYAYGAPGADIDAADAWNVSVGSPNVAVAVLDTGIDLTHSDLAANIWQDFSACQGISDFTTCAKFDDGGNCLAVKPQGSDSMDDNGHGTHVSGVIGAAGNNGNGIAGVMWSVKLIALKVLNADGEGQDSDIEDAINCVIAMRNSGVFIPVMNASFGGDPYNQDLKDAIAKAGTAGVLFVAAAGNGGADGVGDNNDVTPFYPASYVLPNIISVAATDQDDMRVPFSNFGPTTVQVGAPGVYIWSTVPMSVSAMPGFGILETMEGTSMAAPHVTGLVGLLNSYYYNFTTSQIRTLVLRYVDILPSLDGWISTGGRINAFKSMSSLWAPGNFGGKSTTSKITLKWINRATDSDGYILERSNDGITYSLLQTLPSKAKSYSDKGLTEGTKYYYRLRTFNDIGESPTAAEASVATRLNPPTKLNAKAISNSQVMLTWKDNSGSEDGFEIERRSIFGDLAEFHVTTNVVSFIDSGLEPGTYFYRVRAFSAAAGNSANSNTVSINLGTAGGE